MKELLKHSALGVALMLTACSQEEFVNVVETITDGGAEPEGIVVNVAEFKREYESPQTRSTISVSADGTDYQFLPRPHETTVLQAQGCFRGVSIQPLFWWFEIY